MAKAKSEDGLKELAETVRNLTIVQLGLAGVPQQAIQKIVGCDMNRVNSIVRNLKRRPAGRGDH